MREKKCPMCMKITSLCKCDNKVCICGHTLGMHRFVKCFKPTACLDVHKGQDVLFEEYCNCNKFVEVSK